jgi:hypothetical protein
VAPARLWSFPTDSLATPTCWEEEKGGGEERKVRGAIKKSKLEARLYIKKSFVGKRMMGSLVTINVRGFCTAFLRKNATG